MWSEERHIRLLLRMLILTSFISVGGCTYGAHESSLRWADTINGPIDRDELVKILRQLPPDYSPEAPNFDIDVLVARGGGDLVPLLLTIVHEPTQDPKVSSEAWKVLRRFNDPRTFKELAVQGKSGRVSDSFVADFIVRELPGPYGFHPPPGQAARWLEARLRAGGFEGLVLGLLDETMKNPDSVYSCDERLIRWLNLEDGQDFDVVLRQKSPQGVAFRNEELLHRHYDPLVAFGPEFIIDQLGSEDVTLRVQYMAAVTRNRRVRALKRMFPSEAARQACESLFYEYVTVEISAARATSQHSIAWYWRNRSHLHFNENTNRIAIDGGSR